MANYMGTGFYIGGSGCFVVLLCYRGLNNCQDYGHCGAEEIRL